ncbi:MAG: HPF/RaiA family ribosome-associated protein [Bacteroidales bacterium]
MRVTIQTLHFKADKKLEQFVSSKIEKLGAVYEGVIGSEVILRLENVDDNNNKIAEIRLLIPGSDLFARKQSKTFEEAADQAVDALRRQLTKHKAKIRAK